jgi:hypothetical protein
MPFSSCLIIPRQIEHFFAPSILETIEIGLGRILCTTTVLLIRDLRKEKKSLATYAIRAPVALVANRINSVSSSMPMVASVLDIIGFLLQKS